MSGNGCAACLVLQCIAAITGCIASRLQCDWHLPTFKLAVKNIRLTVLVDQVPVTKMPVHRLSEQDYLLNPIP